MKKLALILMGAILLASCKKDQIKITPTLSFTVNAHAVGDAAYTLRPPTSDSDGGFTYTSSDPGVATISGSTITVKAAGSTQITATQASSGNYLESSVTKTLTVVPAGTYVIGQAVKGGIVFYVNGTGIHGYMISGEDISTAAPWTNGSLTGVTALTSSLGGGAVNTTNIIAALGDGTYAAKLCRDYRGGEFTDWYLPSLVELQYIRLYRDLIGGIIETSYWSSTEVSATLANANFIYMGPGTLTGTTFNTAVANNYTKTSMYSVRAIRAF
jgi:hypothetical protein